MKTAALIMAGGHGERFWPRSRKNMPKQFLDLTGNGKSMLRLTVERILPMVSMEDIFISTNESYRNLIREHIPEIPDTNILYEPTGRNTAPSIGMAAVHIKRKYGDAIMIVLPADHLIKYNAMFLGTLRTGVDVARKDSALVTIGITPSYPETDYGYIRFQQDQYAGNAFVVKEFIEKPGLDMAKNYFECEEYLWNSGMFIWKVSSILKDMERYLPGVYRGLISIENALGSDGLQKIVKEVFEEMESISIDYGILEKAKHIYCVPGTFGWDDMGSWTAISRLKTENDDGNILSGNAVSLDTNNCIIEVQDKLFSLIGMQDTIVVDTKDATLICKKDKAKDIRNFLRYLEKRGMDSYL